MNVHEQPVMRDAVQRRRLALGFAVSVLAHLALTALSPLLRLAPPSPANPGNVAHVVLKRTPATAVIPPKEVKPPPAPKEKETAAGPPQRKLGTGAGAPALSKTGTPGRRPGGVRLRPAPAIPRPAATGGGSPAPSIDLTGHGGARGPVQPIEDVIYSGGGRGGADLPRVAPRIGGGGGQAVLAAVTPTNRPATVRAADETGRGPGEGGGAGTGKDGGVGFADSRGIGTRADSPVEAGTLRSAPDGRGIGAAAQGERTGTVSPGGGTGTGSTLPGTGGTGQGYGRGSGGDIGDGREGGAAGDGGRGAIFGVGTGGGGGGPLRIVYILDVSLSMEEKNKMGKAKAELKKTLSALRPVDTFNVIAFDGAPHPFEDSLLPANPENIRRAIEFVERVPMGEGTNFGDALELAFRSGAASHVYLLSDGYPTVGITDGKKLRRFAKERNRHGAQIVAIALGLGQRFDGVPLLKSLADESGGKFEYVNLR